MLLEHVEIFLPEFVWLVTRNVKCRNQPQSVCFVVRIFEDQELSEIEPKIGSHVFLCLVKEEVYGMRERKEKV